MRETHFDFRVRGWTTLRFGQEGCQPFSLACGDVTNGLSVDFLTTPGEYGHPPMFVGGVASREDMERLRDFLTEALEEKEETT